MVSNTKIIYVFLFLVVMASFSVARNQDKTVDDLKDNEKENLNRNQRKNSIFNERRCVPRNGRCATDLDCCNNIPCNGLNGNNRCVSDREFNQSIVTGWIIAVVIFVGCFLIGFCVPMCFNR